MPSSGCQKCARSEEHTSELQSHDNLVCRLLLEKKIDNLQGLLLTRLLFAAKKLSVQRAVRLGLALKLAQLDIRLADCFFLSLRGPPISSLFPLPALFQ